MFILNENSNVVKMCLEPRHINAPVFVDTFRLHWDLDLGRINAHPSLGVWFIKITPKVTNALLSFGKAVKFAKWPIPNF